MKVEIYGYNNNLIDNIPAKNRKALSEAVGKELSALNDPMVKSLEAAKKTLVVDFLEITPKTIVDARLFDSAEMPISGKMCLLDMKKLNEFSDPKLLAQHFMSLIQKVVDNAKMLR